MCVCVYVRMCVRMLVWVRPFECKKNYGTCCCVVEEGGGGEKEKEREREKKRGGGGGGREDREG